MNTNLGLIARKLGTTQVFDEEGLVHRVTVLHAGPCTILGKRTPQVHGYAALQLGFGTRKPSRVRKPEMGLFEKLGVEPPELVREFRVEPELLEQVEVKQVLRVADVFEAGSWVDVTGRSKGRGYTGVMKRHNFSGAATKTHGTHEYKRHGGSIGMNMDPGRVFPGKRMAGHYGDERVTVLNLKLVEVVSDEDLLLVRGSVPGPRNGIVLVKPSVKKARVQPPLMAAAGA